MNPIKIKIPKSNKPSIMKETPEERKERIKYVSALTTKVVPNKKYRSRAQQKREDHKIIKGGD